MTPMPARCVNGHVYLVDGVIGGSASGVTMRNVGLGGGFGCTICGAQGQILDGTYNLSEQAFELLSGPRWSVDALRRLVAEVRLAQIGQLPPEGVVAYIDDQDPQMGVLIRKLGKSGLTLITILGFVLAMVEFVQSQNTATELQDILHEQRTEQAQTAKRSPIARRPSTTPPTQRNKRSPKTYGKNKRSKRNR